MKLVLFTTCLWHTTLVHPSRSLDKTLVKYVDLVNQPKVGKKVHDNGLIWRVKETHRSCDDLRVKHETETK